MPPKKPASRGSSSPRSPSTRARLTGQLGARYADPVSYHAIVFMAGVLEQLVFGIVLQREARGPGPRHHYGILGGDLVGQELIVDARKFFSDLHLLAGGEAIPRR